MLSQLHYHVQIEPYCPTIQQYPDILVNSKYVIEIQFSRIDIEEIIERTKGFKTAEYGSHLVNSRLSIS